ncbi:MAG: hypothetical protein PUC18_12720 [Prevotellaceae bacterium]|nr:hypothetical protein [Prevotellaceae bacterium]
MEQRIITLGFCGAVVLLFYVVTLLLIFADLWAGVRKAKQRGEMRTSEAYKRTIDKISKYFNMLFALTLVDFVQIALIYFVYHEYDYDFIMFPWFALLGTFYVGFVEVKSIMEPSDIKEAKQQQDFKRLLLELAKNSDMRDKLINLLKEQGNKKDGE